MKRFATHILLVLTLLVSPGTTAAQVRPGGPQGRGQNRLELERRVMQGFGRMVQERLDLTQDEMEALQGVMQSFREDRQALGRSQAALRLHLRGAALQEGGEDQDALELLEEMVRLQEAELELYRREQAELLTVLTPVQLVRFYQLRDEFGRRVQQLRGGGPPGGPGGVGGTLGRPWGRGSTLDTAWLLGGGLY